MSNCQISSFHRDAIDVRANGQVPELHNCEIFEYRAPSYRGCELDEANQHQHTQVSVY